MKKEDMLKVITAIDDDFILDNEIKKDSTALPEKKEEKVSKKVFWFRAAGAVAAVLAVCIIIGSVSGIGMMKTSDAAVEEGYYEYASSTASYKNSGLNYSKSEMLYESDYDASTEDLVVSESSDAASDIQTATLQQETKLVYRASLEIQTTDYDESEKNLKSLVSQYGGYFESSYIYNGSYGYDANKNGSYTIRIPAENYRTFIDSVGDGWHVVNINETTTDIGTQYFETEKRVETLKIKQERLQELLKQASNMTDIITLESELSDTEYEIELYTTTLNKYDSLVGYSTITVEIQEVNKYDGSAVEKESFISKVGRYFKNGLTNAADMVLEIIYTISYNAVQIVILIAAVIIIRKNHLIARLINKFKKQ